MTQEEYFDQASKELKIHTEDSILMAISDFKESLNSSRKVSYYNTIYDIGVAYHLLSGVTNRGIIYKNRYCNKAFYFYRKALKSPISMNKNDIYNNIGCLYTDLFRSNKSKFSYINNAIDYFSLAIRNMKELKDSDPYLNKARAYLIKGSEIDNYHYYRKAINIYEDLSKRDPNNSNEYDFDESAVIYKLLNEDFINNKYWILCRVHKTINPFSKRNINTLTRRNTLNVEHFLGDCLSYLNNHLVKIDFQTRNKYLYQYTSISTLGNICGLNNSENSKPESKVFHLRLYNSDYMNDPMEGKTLLDKLISVKISPSFNNNKVKRVLHMLYPHDLKDLHAGKVYMASLSSASPLSYDSMPLWNLYADNHKGVVMGMSFNGVEHGKYDFNINNHKMTINGINYFNHKINTKSNKIPLKMYKISYDVNDVNNIHKLEYKCNELKGIEKRHMKARIENATHIRSIARMINSFPYKILRDKHLRYVIRYNLDRIRFLLKSGVYKYEKEYRVMEEITNYNQTHFDKGNEKLFISLNHNSSINADLKEIVFGSRCKSNYWLPFVERQLGSGIKLSKSNIHYR